MRTTLIFLTLLCWHSHTFAQQNDFFSEDNSLSKVYRKNNIEECKIYTSGIKLGFLDFRYLETIQYYDSLGNLIKTKEFLGLKKSDGWEEYFNYNENNQIKYEEWYWVEEKDWEKTEYKYDSEGRVVEYCDYHKYDLEGDYILDSCVSVTYKNGLISSILNEDHDTIYYFKYENGLISKYSYDGYLIAEYKNNFMTKLISNDFTYNYHRNELGQIQRTVILNSNNEITGFLIFNYKDGLPVKTLYKNSKGKVTSTDKYKYKKYKNDS